MGPKTGGFTRAGVESGRPHHLILGSRKRWLTLRGRTPSTPVWMVNSAPGKESQSLSSGGLLVTAGLLGDRKSVTFC